MAARRPPSALSRSIRPQVFRCPRPGVGREHLLDGRDRLVAELLHGRILNRDPDRPDRMARACANWPEDKQLRNVTGNRNYNLQRIGLKRMSELALEQANVVVDEALSKAEELGTLMNVAVVDAGGNLKAFGRMDGAWLGSIDIAIKKAKTARLFDMNTGELGVLSQPGGPLYNIEVSNGGLITFPGGVPLRNDSGNVIGAIGVSGSTVDNDHAVAEAGAKALS